MKVRGICMWEEDGGTRWQQSMKALTNPLWGTIGKPSRASQNEQCHGRRNQGACPTAFNVSNYHDVGTWLPRSRNQGGSLTTVRSLCMCSHMSSHSNGKRSYNHSITRHYLIHDVISSQEWLIIRILGWPRPKTPHQRPRWRMIVLKPVKSLSSRWQKKARW